MNTNNIEEKFFSEANERTIVSALLKSTQSRLGVGIDERQARKAERIVRHYMGEVWDYHGPMPINELNRKVFDVSTAPFIDGFRLVNTQAPAPVNTQAVAPVQAQAQPTQQKQRQTAAPAKQKPTEEFMSVEDRYSKLQQERTSVKDNRPPIPDFKISIESDKDGPSPGELYEQEMRKREEEAARVQAALDAAQGKKPQMGGTPVKSTTSLPGVKIMPNAVMLAESTGIISQQQLQFPTLRELAQAQGTAPEQSQKKTKVEEEELDSMMNMDNIARLMSASQLRDVRDPIGNPTTARPDYVSARNIQQQDILIRDDPIVSYKEHEDNLFLYSADRDWVNDDTQTRYNFTINFDTANNKQGFNKNLSVAQRFKNISRIEMIKAILPIEGVETFFGVDGSGTPVTAVAPYTYKRISAYQFPYISLRIPELDVNNYGSDDQLNNSFAVLQYDTEWNTDAFYPAAGETNSGNTSGNTGFTTFIPKHLKCQKVYQPTPLATLSKLSIELNRPDGSQLSYLPDIVDISSVVFCESGSANASLYFSNKAIDSPAGNSYYIVLRTKKFFNRWSFSVGDRIQVGGITPEQISNTASNQAKYELLDYLQDTTGHTIVGVGYDAGTTGSIVDGYNSFGYGNWIAIRAPINDPTTGLTTVRTIGGDQTAYNNLQTALTTSSIQKGRVLNLTHQTQLVFRIITREKDSTSRVRPDNL